jgi:hypothetical protein
MGGEKSPQGAAENIRLVFKFSGRLRWSFAKRRLTCLSLKKFYGDSSNSQTNPPSSVSIRSIRIPIRRRWIFSGTHGQTNSLSALIAS